MSNQEETTTPEKSDYFVYGLANPLKPTKTNYIGGPALHEYEFFYFGFTGEGDEKRLSQHLQCQKADKNYHKKNTIKKIERNDEKVIFVKLLVDVNKQTAINKEIESIAYYGRHDLGLGPLTNKTNGGEAGSGAKNKIDLTGQKFGRLVVLEESGKNRWNNISWLCLCDCGKEKEIIGKNLRNGKTKSCGCLRKEISTNRASNHNKHGCSEYFIWRNMIKRCNNSNHKYYSNKGIKVCERWLDIDAFLEDMGDRPSDKHRLLRIDKNKNFSKENCIWKLNKLSN